MIKQAPRTGRGRWIVLPLAVIAAGCGLVAPSSLRGAQAPAGPATATGAAEIERGYAKLPTRFEANEGQADRRVEFLTRGFGYSMFLTRRELVIAKRTDSGAGAAVRMRMLGSSPRSRPVGVGQTAGRTNYATGNDPEQWHSNVPSFSKVRYGGIYPGVDVDYYGRQGELEYDFVVAPRADPNPIAIGFKGVRKLIVDRGGDLLLRTNAGTLRQRRPVIYQGEGSARRLVTGGYVLKGTRRVGFRLGAYDRAKPLVIDPVLAYSGYLGGGGRDDVRGITVDSSGSAYVTGTTSSADFPTKDASQGSLLGAGDAFVTKLDPDGALVYSTYLGGTGFDGGADIAIAPSCPSGCEAYVTGGTLSLDFPTSADALGKVRKGFDDAFVTRLNDRGMPVDSTYLGGSGRESGLGVGVGPSGDPYVTGQTQSPDFPTKDPAQPSFALSNDCGVGGICSDAFVTKLNPRLSSLSYSTYLGGTGEEREMGITVDSAGGAYLTGQTTSTDFPTTVGAFDRVRGSGGFASDIFVTKLTSEGQLTPQGAQTAYSTYLGGDGSDSSAGGIAVDAAGSAYVTGNTVAADFPTTEGAFDRTRSDADLFVSKLNPEGSGLSYSTFLGGSSQEGFGAPPDVAVDASGSAYVGGDSFSDDFPSVGGLQARAGEADAVVTKLNSEGSALSYSTYLGGKGNDFIRAVAVDTVGNAYVGGSTDSSDFPTAGPSRRGQGNDGFVSKIELGGSGVGVPIATSVSPSGGALSGGTSVTIRGSAFTGATAVKFGEVAATTLTVDTDGQITAVSPPHPAGVVDVTVVTPGGISAPNANTKFTYGEGTWRSTASPESGGASLTLLPTGKVLKVGGTKAEIYDPSSETWSPTAGPVLPRVNHTATLLAGPGCGSNCGKVLVTGDFGSGEPATTSAELFDPAGDGGKGSWRRTADLRVRRYHHTATLLASGKVLVVGGCPAVERRSLDCTHDATDAGSRPLASAEIYDPVAEQWTPTRTPPTAPRSQQSATLLTGPGCGDNCGKVLLVGGVATSTHEPNPFAPPELFDPATETWGSTQNADDLLRFQHAAVTLADGDVLVAGGTVGESGEFLNSAFRYDPAANSFEPTAILNAFRAFDRATLLPSGKALLVGGPRTFEGAAVVGEIYDPRSREGRGGWLLANPRGGDASLTTLLSNGPGGFAAGPNCGKNCGKVLATRGSEAKLYTPPPSITTIAPATGPLAGGTEVTVEGTGFTHDVSAVKFGAVPAQSFTVDSFSRLRAVAPARATNASVMITVINEGGVAQSADGYTYADPTGAGGGSGIGSPVTPGSGGPQTGPMGPQAGPLGPQTGPGGEAVDPGLVGSEVARALRRCVAAGRIHTRRHRIHTRRHLRLARKGSPATRARRRAHLRNRARRRAHLRNHRRTLRKRCLRRFGRTPGRVTKLRARPTSSSAVLLRFRAPGTNRKLPPAARAYLVKQSTTPIRSRRDFRRARTLCSGFCRFTPTRVGARLTLSVTDLQPRTTYYYSVAARDNVSLRLGRRSRTVKATTP